MAEGSELDDVASWGIVGATVKGELRRGKETAFQLQRINLFGPHADRIQKSGDVPMVQILKEMGVRYDEAVMNGDGMLAQKHLLAISSLLSSTESHAGSRLQTALKLLVEQAKYQVKMVMHGGEDAAQGTSVAELEGLIKDQDAKAALKTAMDTANKED